MQGAAVKPSSALITDFSDAVPDPDHAGQYLFGSTVGDPGGTSSFASGTVGTLRVAGGALVFTATVEPPTTSNLYPYNGFAAYFDGSACADASAYQGVSFSLTVSGTCEVLFMFTDTEHIRPTDDPERGTCLATDCYPSQFVVTSATTMLSFDALPTAAYGKPIEAVDPSKLIGLQWQFGNPTPATAACTGSITVDNIRFY